MKKFIVLAVMLVSMVVCHGQVLESGPSIVIGTRMWESAPSDSWGVEAGAGYRHFLLKRVHVNPQMSLFYNRYNEIKPNSIGLNARVDVGYISPSAIGFELFTGPDFDIAFMRPKGNAYVGGYSVEPVINTAVLRWRFGLGVNVGRFTIKGAYALGLTNVYVDDYDDYKNNIEFSVAYHL